MRIFFKAMIYRQPYLSLDSKTPEYDIEHCIVESIEDAAARGATSGIPILLTQIL